MKQATKTQKSDSMTTLSNQWVQFPNPGLRAYFKRVETGSDEEYRSTFYKGRSLEEILSGWQPKLDKIKDDWPTLVDFEDDLKSKVGPMSIMKPLNERFDDVQSYYDSILLESKPISDEALDATAAWLKPIYGLRLRSYERTLEVMKKSTNSGLPYFQKRRNVMDDVIAQSSSLRLDDNGVTTLNHHGVRKGLSAILGWRGQEGGPSPDDVKQRVVWMFPFAVNLAELRMYQPLITACQQHNLVPAWVSMESVDREITQLFDTKGHDELVVVTDFSKFDQHFNPHMQQAAEHLLRCISTNDSDATSWFDNVFGIKYEIPLMCQLNQGFTGKHGMGSGSGGTNADETLVHKSLQFEAALSHGSQLNPHSMCLGDDGILSYPGITVDDVVQTYSQHGQEMNTDKQYASKHDCTYLRRWHHEDYRMNNICVGVYSTYRALGRLAEQERYYDPDVWSAEMVALRQLSIIENCKYHPLREEFADYCMKGDRYRLGLDLPGFLDNLTSIAEKATNLLPDFLGYTKSMQTETNASPASGIQDWWIVRYLNSKK